MQNYAHLVELEKCCQTYIFIYFLAKFRFDKAENEPAKNLQNFANLPILLPLPLSPPSQRAGGRGRSLPSSTRGGRRPGGKRAPAAGEPSKRILFFTFFRLRAFSDSCGPDSRLVSAPSSSGAESTISD